MEGPIRLGRRLPLFAVLTLVAGTALSCVEPQGELASNPPQMPSGEGEMIADIVRLEAGKPREARLEAGRDHRYSLSLEPGEYVHVRAEQKGSDVEIVLRDPSGERLVTVDSPTGTEGTEELSWIASEGGEHELEVRSIDAPGHPGGSYAVELAERRPATPEDRTFVEAQTAFLAGEGETGSEAALARYEKASELWGRIGELARRADAEYRIGQLLDDRRQRQGALERLRRSAELAEEARDLRRAAVARTRLGRLLLELRRFEESYRVHRRAVALYEELADPEGLLDAWNGLAQAARSTGRFEEAYTAYETAMELGGDGLSGTERADLQLGIAGVDLSLDRLPEAIDRLRRVVELYDRAGSPAQARALRLLGEALYRNGRLQEAERTLERSLALRSDDSTGEAMTRNSLGTVLLAAGRLDEARGELERARAIFEREGDRHSEGLALHKLGRVRYAEDDFAAAFEHHEKAVQLLAGTGDAQAEAAALFGAARALRAAGRLEEAYGRLLEVTEEAEALRSGSVSLDHRASYLASRTHYWELLVDVLTALAEERPGEGFEVAAFETSERWRARSLLDHLGRNATLQSRPLTAEQQEQEERLFHLIELWESMRSSRHATADLAVLEAEERRLLSLIERLRSRLAPESPRHPASGDGRPSSLAEIQRELEPETVLVAYFLSEPRSFAWVVTAGSLTSAVLAPRGEIENEVERTLALLQETHSLSRSARRRSLRRLSELLLEPISDSLAGRRLLVVGDAGLQRLPFAALPDPASGEPLVTTRVIAHLPSASILAPLRRTGRSRPRAADGIAVLADPVTDANDPRLTGVAAEPPEPRADLLRSAGLAGLPRLPETAREARAILELAGPDEGWLAEGFAARPSVLLDGELEDFRILHVAAHGIVHPEHPELSGLVLSLFDADGDPVDGVLRLHEIRDLDLRAELVVLSACRTGTGPSLRGEGMMSFGRGFLAAGVPRVVVSLWPVRDRSTAELMRRFYRHHLRSNLAPAAALAAAQRSMLAEEEWEEPHHWAGFVFLGEGAGSGNREEDWEDDSIGEKDTGGSTEQVETADDDLSPPRPPRTDPPPPEGPSS